MSYTVKDVLALKSMTSAKCVAGLKGLYNKVDDVIIMEAHDIEKWLQPKQLILSSLFSLKGSSNNQYFDFIRRVKKHGGSGIIVKVGRFVDEIPFGLIDGCNEYEIPLMLIGEAVYYREIILEVMQNILNQKAAMLDVYQNIHNIFIDLSLRQPTQLDILKTLKDIIERDIILEDDLGNVLCTTEVTPGSYIVIDKRQLYKDDFMHYRYLRELLEQNGQMLSRVVCEIPDVYGNVCFLKIFEREDFVEMVDYMAIENAARSIQLEHSKMLALRKEHQIHYNDLFDHLINGKYKDNDELIECALGLSLNIESNYRVVTWRLRKDTKVNDISSIDIHTKLISENQEILQKLRENFKDNAYRVYADRITLIVIDQYEDELEFKRFISEKINDTVEHFKTRQLEFRVAISDRGKLSSIKKLAQQAMRIIQLTEMLQRNKVVLLYRELGLYKLFIQLSNDNDLSEYIPTAIDTINNHDPEYLETLKVFLNNKHNLKDTADSLYVHPKTVRYRLDKIKELTDIDFNDAEEMLQLSIGIRIFELIQTPIL